MAVITLEKIKKRYENVSVLNEIDLVIEKKEFLLTFINSDKLINMLYCIKPKGILNSELYTKDGSYQLIITAEGNPFIKQQKIYEYCKISQDKILISTVSEHHYPICKQNALEKMMAAFKAL